MKANADDFKKHFELLSDEALLDVRREDLVEMAQACYDEEISRRGLDEEPEVEAGESVETAGEATEGAPEETPADDPGPLVSIAEFTRGDEAGLARGLLMSAGIPVFFENEKAALGALHLLVPESYVEAALEVLDPGTVTDEDLEAQAEAAGYFEEEFDEEFAEAGQEDEPEAD